MLTPPQVRCRDCSAVILAMIKTDRLSKPLVIEEDKTRRIPWGLSFAEKAYNAEYRKRVAAAALIVVIVAVLAAWAMLGK
jgi:hypothetical protein